jgi:hypothetical protein
VVSLLGSMGRQKMAHQAKVQPVNTGDIEPQGKNLCLRTPIHVISTYVLRKTSYHPVAPCQTPHYAFTFHHSNFLLFPCLLIPCMRLSTSPSLISSSVPVRGVEPKPLYSASLPIAIGIGHPPRALLRPFRLNLQRIPLHIRTANTNKYD